MRKYYDSDGKPVDKKTARLLFGKVWEYNEAASEYSRENTVDKDANVKDFCEERLQNDEDVKSEKMRELIETGIDMLSGIAACDLDKLSLKYYWMEDDLPVPPLIRETKADRKGERPFLDSTYDPIVQYIAHPSLSKNLIKLNTKIISLTIDTTKTKPITLMTSVYEPFNVDSVIVTIPLGCLKRDAITFTPALPGKVQRALANLGFGTLEKMFIRFDRAWWLQPVPETEKIGLEFYRFPSLLSTKDAGIPKGGLSFVSLARTHHPQPVFLIFLATSLAEYLVAKPKDELQKMLQQHYIPHLPNYDASDQACLIRDLECSTWSQEELSGFGSYTHIPAGSDTGNENMKILSEKILDVGEEGGGVWFAGEHTADTEVIDGRNYTTMATVTGAYKTGERAAKKVLETYSIATPEPKSGSLCRLL